MLVMHVMYVMCVLYVMYVMYVMYAMRVMCVMYVMYVMYVMRVLYVMYVMYGGGFSRLPGAGRGEGGGRVSLPYLSVTRCLISQVLQCCVVCVCVVFLALLVTSVCNCA